MVKDESFSNKKKHVQLQRYVNFKNNQGVTNTDETEKDHVMVNFEKVNIIISLSTLEININI